MSGKIKNFIEEFKAFALRGNMMDMAVGIIIGGAFTGIVTSLTDNFINPILNFVTGAETYTLQNVAGLHPALFLNWSTSLSWLSFSSCS